MRGTRLIPAVLATCAALLAPGAAHGQTLTADHADCVGTADWEWSEADQSFTVTHSFPEQTCYGLHVDEDLAEVLPAFLAAPRSYSYTETYSATAVNCGDGPLVAALSYDDGQPDGRRGTGLFAGATAEIAYTQPGAGVAEHVFTMLGPVCSSGNWAGTALVSFQMTSIEKTG